MKIGIFIGNQNVQKGGADSFEKNIINELHKNHYSNIFVFSYGKGEISNASNIKHIKIKKYKRIKYELLGAFRNKLYKLFKNTPASALDEEARKHHIELMYFITPAYEEVFIPYVYILWDLAHRRFPFFPEINYSGWSWQKRESYYQKVLPKALKIVVGTNEGKKDVEKYYGVEGSNVEIIPLMLSEKLTEYTFSKEQKKLQTKSKYLLYPAQFWPHKNHIRLLAALKVLQEKYNKHFSLVFTGSDKGNMNYIKRKTEEFNLSNSVQMRGYIEVEELAYLYQNAFSLVFPTFFGPDNLPPLEAMSLGCPVIASNIPGSKDQLGDAALYFDPLNEEEIAFQINFLDEHPDKREALIKKGHAQVKLLTSENYVKKLFSIADEFTKTRMCWDNKKEYVNL